MSAPFSPLGLFGGATGFVLAVLIGFGFGFTLERAGFGSSRRLAAQFYLYDMTVFKVMFTSIVTAMVGLFGLARLGWIEFDLVWVNLTYLGPQIVGGLLLGAGFLLSGYCPGTSIVASASGKIDGVLTIAGVAIGIGVFSVAYSPALEAFHRSGDYGRLLLSDLIAIDPIFASLGIAVMAAAAFIGAEAVERKFASRAEPGRRPFGMPATRLAVTGGLVVIAIAFALAPAGSPETVSAKPAADSIAPIDLARHLVEGNGDWMILDLRAEPDAEADGSIPGSLAVDPAELDDADAWWNLFPTHRMVILVDDGNGDAAALRVPSTHRAAILDGGFPAWKRQVLTAPEPPGEATPEAMRSYVERAALVSYFTGTDSPALTVPVAAPPPAPAGGRQKPKASGGCS